MREQGTIIAKFVEVLNECTVILKTNSGVTEINQWSLNHWKLFSKTSEHAIVDVML